MNNIIGYCFQSLGGTSSLSVGYVTVICPYTKQAKMYSGLTQNGSTIEKDIDYISLFGGSVSPEVAAAYWKHSCHTTLLHEKYGDILENIKFVC